MKIRIDKTIVVHNMELTVGVDATTGQIGRMFGISDYEAALWLGEEMSNTSLALVSIDDKLFVIFVLNEGGFSLSSTYTTLRFRIFRLYF